MKPQDQHNEPHQPQGGPDVASWAEDAALGKLGRLEHHTLKGTCVQFQFDLSCLVDGELDKVAADRAIEHLDACPSCADFFDGLRAQVRAHRDLENAEELVARYATWVGADDGLESIELVTKLANIFYQLGKAYVLSSHRSSTRQRVFERAVEVDSTQTAGRGFVDGVLASGRESAGGVNWKNARRMLNGQLARIESPVAKGRALLNEALVADSTHEEARLYLAFLDIQEGRTIRAAEDLRDLFRTAIDPANRAHAAIQLGLLLAKQREFRRAVACFRWVIASGLADEDDRFFVARFNVGIYYAQMRDEARSLRAFRALLDRHPGRVTEVADLFLNSDNTRRVIESMEGFLERLVATCPELFGLDPAHDGAGTEGRRDER